MDERLVKIDIFPKEVRYTLPLGNGFEVIRVLLATTVPRFSVYFVNAEKQFEPLSLSLEDLKWYVEDAQRRYASAG